MEITKRNFKSLLPNILDAIEKCDFIAIDAEFTGLRPTGYNLCELDTLEERYAKIRHSAQQYGMIQFGISTFRYSPNTKRYTHATFCFYLLAKPGANEVIDTSSLNFLANNGFDFNKLYKDGLPYMTLKEEGEKKLKLKETPLEGTKPSPVKVTEIAAKTFLKETENKIVAFMKDENCQEMILEGKTLTGFHRKLIYNNIAAKFENILIQSVNCDTGGKNLLLKKFNSVTARLQHLEEERQQNLDEKIGFTHVIRKLLESDKPLVGHNCFLDIAHLFEKMVMPLPEKVEAFKKMVLTNFPLIYDTKLIAKDPPFSADIPNTGLEALFGDLCNKYDPPLFEVESGLESHSIRDSSKAHDAGYDAFMTGVCFVSMLKTLEGPRWTKKSLVESKHLLLYANRINIMHSYDIPLINLSASDAQPDRSKIFVVECPESWSQADVYGLFSLLKSLKIVWVNSTSLYVIPTEEIDMKTCRKHLKAIHATCPPLVHVRLYNDSAGSKRKSESDSGPAESLAPNPKEFKRLKSVGSSQLSQMTLESPSADDNHKMITDDIGGSKGGKNDVTDGVFQVPDDW
ncbi:hypothetical protein SK128_024198 [Halocaridina rubra]|uniref:Poly(A)-specific ribonuclease RNA-binding domain-containing protein n=1 Tax=Halocaridina rubra TaxID=373956 RepID=A0AAN8XDQ4_HALRR